MYSKATSVYWERVFFLLCHRLRVHMWADGRTYGNGGEFAKFGDNLVKLV